MKKIIIYIFGVVALALLFAACEKNEPILFSNEDSFIAFMNGAADVNEATVVGEVATENVIAIPVMLVTFDNSPVTVEFDFSVEGIPEAIQAIENEAYTLLNDSKELNFAGGDVEGSTMGYDTIFIQTIDNEIFTGNRRFHIDLLSNSAGYDFGTLSTTEVTIVDNEHPLNIVLGNYSVEATSVFGGSANTNIATSAVEGTLEQVSFPLGQLIPGWGVPPTDLVYATVNLEESTFNIQIGQDYASFGYGPCKISGYDGETGERMEDGLYVRGTFDADGNIVLSDQIGVIITDGNNVDLSFEIWEAGAVWTKTSKKDFPSVSEKDISDLIQRRY